MNTFWHFPAATGGLINSINHAGLETFRGNALESLTREICQNSLDAVKNEQNPVIVEFSSFTTYMNQVPGINELKDVFLKCQETWKGKNQQCEYFLENALQIVQQPTIQILRISDFNTKGLEGAKEGELGSPWSSLVKEAGSSNKHESSGGSFGIGKSAPFLNSKLRTLFYSSLDITGYESFIGVANIMSFKKNPNEITLGNGYYTHNENSNAIPQQLFLEPGFVRKDTGTDIYVTAFEPGEDWEQEIIKSVLHNFFITIYKKKLVVRINDFEISDKNIAQLISDLEDTEENRHLQHYFHLLTSDQTIKVAYPAQRYKQGISFAEGEATLYLMNGEDLNRRVLMTRTTGMRLFEQKNISGSISFTGILMITGKNMNTIFKQMENPAHNEWSPERYEKDPKLAKKVYADLRSFIRNAVKEHFQEKITDSMDAIGLSDFLPNKKLVNMQGVNKTESLHSSIKQILKKEIKEESRKATRQRGLTTEDVEAQLAGEYGITPTGEEGGNGSGKHSGGGNSGGGVQNPSGQNQLDKGMTGGLDRQRQQKPSSEPIQIAQRYVCIDKERGKYCFVITAKKAIEKGRLIFKVIGEQNDFDLPIQNATTDDPNVTVEKCGANKIDLHSIPAKKPFIINVEIAYPNYCVMEVELYEN
ncbi:hypothetical protein [Anoxybacteroides tepidamans]|uniref:hypothetical protein n=1 Tax=Anoxybacteroides tepidamans TaxID=265948 RepID=UPI0006852918|nr:hypothetical protein [Anoxybacillus tepidamans]